jgi:hypothetical protein
MIKPLRTRWTGNVARMEQMSTAHKILVYKPEGKRLLEEEAQMGG